MPEEEIFKYLEILKKSVSGTVEKNIHTIEFPTSAENEGGQQDSLNKLRLSKLKDDTMLRAYFDKIIDSYSYVGNYVILVFHDVYDVVGKATDGNLMEDVTEEVYEYIITCICPVNLQKAGLMYSEQENGFTNLDRKWVVGMPDKAFLFPAFNDRSADIHSIVYYEKKPDDKYEELYEAIIGKEMPLTASEEKESFAVLVQTTLGKDCDMEIVKNIHEKLAEKLEENEEAKESVKLGKAELKAMLEESGADKESLEDYDRLYDENVGKEVELTAVNIVNKKAFEVASTDISIKINPHRADLLETKTIDGRRCLVIELNENVKVNGVEVNK